MRKCSLALLCLSALLLLAACGASTTPQPYTNMRTVTAISAKVAAHYGETHPKITRVSAMLSDGDPTIPINLVGLDGQFHKGSLVATHLSFSMRADGSQVWAIYATGEQTPSTREPVWVDHEIDVTH